MLQFALAVGNGIGVHASNPGEEGDTATAALLGEKADEQSAGAFVSGSDETVDPPMLLSEGTMRLLLADRAIAHRDNTLGRFLRHGTIPLGSILRTPIVILLNNH